MKKYATIVVSGMFASALLLAGCAGQSATTTSSASTTSAASTTSSTSTTSQTETIAGGWTTYDGTTPALNDDIRASWDKAMEAMMGVSYEPVRLLATQVVAGTNYAILARGTTTTETPVTDWYVAVMYVDLEGNASISSIKKIDLADVQVADESASAGDVVGGWEVANPDNSVLEPEDAQQAFNKAREAYVGVELNPIATLGTQVVAGTNYLVLCTGAPVTEHPKNELYVATVYSDLEGGAQMTNVAPLNLLAYVS